MADQPASAASSSSVAGTTAQGRRPVALWLVLAAAAGTFTLAMGTRQTMGFLRGNFLQAAPAGQKGVGTREAVRTAVRNPGHLMLGAGFFVRGFHVAFLATHMPGVIASRGLPVQFGAWLSAPFHVSGR